MRRVFVLINNTSLGGAERRYGRVFRRLALDEPGAHLILNHGLAAKLTEAGVLGGNPTQAWLLPEIFGRLVQRAGLIGTRLGFWIGKLDYLLYACLLFCRYGFSKARLFHVVLGGIYCAAPLRMLSRQHRFLVSVVNPDNKKAVGAALGLYPYEWMIRHAHGVEALTDRVRDQLCARGVRGSYMATPPGSIVDTRHFKAAGKRSWVVFAGRLVEEKNPLLCVDAFFRIKQACPHVRFFLLGTGPLSRAVHERIRQLGMERSVELGFVPDLAPILARARVFLSLQWTDNYPSQSLLEAMASEAVPVATDVGLTWKLVDESTGVRVQPDMGAVSAAVIALLKDPVRCDRLGRAARRCVAERHSEKQYLKHLATLYGLVGQQMGSTAGGQYALRSMR